MRVVMVVLDAFPNRLISPELTPTLHALAERRGARQHLGGVAELTAATYPNHATFVTGVPTVEHGVMTNRVLVDGLWMPAEEVGPTVPTLFDDCRRSGRGSVCVVGDQKLIGVCGGTVADEHWPPQGVPPENAQHGVGGYLADSEVLRVAARLDLAAFDFLFFQLDEVDGARHAYGAWGDEAREQVRRTDASLGFLLEFLRPRWEDTVLMVVSDHDQEDLSTAPPIQLGDHLPEHLTTDAQGTSALVVGSVDSETLLAVPGVTGLAQLSPDHHVVWGDDGQAFGPLHGGRADHGSPRTATQVAIVAGGHPETARIEKKLRAQRPNATRWAEWSRLLLDLPAHHARMESP